MTPADNPSYLRGRAAAARSMLSGCGDRIIRNALQQIADGYEMLALQAEALKKVTKPTVLPVWLYTAFDYVADLSLAMAA